MMKIDYRLFAVFDNIMVRFAVYINDRTDTAGIMLEPRVV